jgi:hypothetical protein
MLDIHDFRAASENSQNAAEFAARLQTLQAAKSGS